MGGRLAPRSNAHVPDLKKNAMLNPIIKNSFLVEVPITTVAVGFKAYFGDIPQLRDKFIYGLEAFTATYVAKGASGTTVMADAGKTDLLLTLNVENTERVYQLPYYTLITPLQGGLVRLFDNLKINLQKSYFTVTQTGNIVANTIAAVNFYYR